MRIIAIDPGYERLGIAVLEREKKGVKEKILFSECFKTKPTLPHSERLLLIGNEVSKVIKEWQPTVMAIETLFFNDNKKTAMAVSEARGVILYAGACAGLTIHEYTPLQIKIAVTGYGRSTKDQIISMIPRLVDIKKEIAHDDEYDAIATGITFFASVIHIK